MFEDLFVILIVVSAMGLLIAKVSAEKNDGELIRYKNSEYTFISPMDKGAILAKMKDHLGRKNNFFGVRKVGNYNYVLQGKVKENEVKLSIYGSFWTGAMLPLLVKYFPEQFRGIVISESKGTIFKGKFERTISEKLFWMFGYCFVGLSELIMLSAYIFGFGEFKVNPIFALSMPLLMLAAMYCFMGLSNVLKIRNRKWLTEYLRLEYSMQIVVE